MHLFSSASLGSAIRGVLRECRGRGHGLALPGNHSRLQRLQAVQ